MVELLTVTVVNFLLFCCNDGIVDRHCCKLSFVLLQQNKRKFTTVMVNNSTNTTKQNKVYNSDGQQFYQYNKTKESLQQ
jgi:hypothetical protein